MLRNVNAIGMSASPERMSERRLRRISGRGQHSLHHVLIGPVRCHGDERRSNESGKNRVLDLEHAFPFVPAIFRRIETGRDEIRQMKSAVALDDFVPAAGNREVKQTERDQRTADHDRGLNEIGPNDGLDSAERGVDRSQNHDDNGRADVNEERFGLAGRVPRIIS